MTITETVGKTAGHIDVSIWYALRGNRSAELVFDTSEFHGIQWYHKDKVPLDRTDRHMERFLKKLYPQRPVLAVSRRPVSLVLAQLNDRLRREQTFRFGKPKFFR